MFRFMFWNYKLVLIYDINATSFSTTSEETSNTKQLVKMYGDIY